MRRFGLEVEFNGDLALARDALAAQNLAPIDLRHTHNSGTAPSSWAVKRDGSVPRGGEMVSPPLDFDDPDQRGQVDKAIEALQAAGATTGQECGIHVHIEAKNIDGTPFSARQIAAVVRFFYKFEDAIYRIASSGWETIRPGASGYAKPIPEDTARAIMNVRTMDDLRAVWTGRQADGTRRASPTIARHHDRYTAVNIMNIPGIVPGRESTARGTIEFRMFNSSLNPKRIQAYIALCMAIVEDARQGHSRSVKKSYRLGAMNRGEVTEQALFLRLQQVLRSESRDTHVLMEEEDWKNLRRICWKGSRPQNEIYSRSY